MRFYQEDTCGKKEIRLGRILGAVRESERGVVHKLEGSEAFVPARFCLAPSLGFADMPP